MCKNLNRDYWNELLSEHYPKLVEFTEFSFNKMKSCKELLLDDTVEVVIEPKTCANQVHDVFEAHARDYFNNIEGIVAGKLNGVFGILIKGKCFIRFNKLNDDYSISNAKTKQRDKFLNQTELSLFDEEITYLNLGYRVDSFWNEIEGIHLVYWNGCFEWEIDIKHQITKLEQSSFEYESNNFDRLQEKRRTIIKQTINKEEIKQNNIKSS